MYNIYHFFCWKKKYITKTKYSLFEKKKPISLCFFLSILVFSRVRIIYRPISFISQSEHQILLFTCAPLKAYYKARLTWDLKLRPKMLFGDPLDPF